MGFRLYVPRIAPILLRGAEAACWAVELPDL